ncbi:MAG TPA: FAD-binding oxidoreductase [Conexibacter sp.]|jgi:FAD/FMN-containing dehydrogenase
MDANAAPPLPAASAAELDALRGQLDGELATPADAAYDELRASWNLAFVQRPAIVVEATCADDVVAALRFAQRHALPVAVQSTGHGSARTTADGGLLVRTSRMRDVTVDPETRVARIAAGARWSDVLPVTATHGLAPLLGFNPHVGVVGYTLGGGLGWLSRAHGLCVDSVHALDVVLPDATRVRVTADIEPDLFWALRGGASSFGVVVAVYLRLVAAPALFGGAVLYPGERAAEVAEAYRGWIATLPDTVTSTLAVVRVPPAPFVPEPLRGRTVVQVGACALAEPADAERLLAPVREGLGEPLLDSFAPVEIESLGDLVMEPVEPMPAGGHALTVPALTPEIAALLVATAEGAQPFSVVELRHLGGATSAGETPCALARPDGELLFHVESVTPPGRAGEETRAAMAALMARVVPHATPTVLPSFLGEIDTSAERSAQALAPESRARLAALKRRYDPKGRFASATLPD